MRDATARWRARASRSTSPSPGSVFTRTSEPGLVDVPSSARPLAPDIAYVVPTFGWERQATTNLKTEVRFGNGCASTCNRPWYSSGAGELLGVVLWPAAPRRPPTRSARPTRSSSPSGASIRCLEPARWTRCRHRLSRRDRRRCRRAHPRGDGAAGRRRRAQRRLRRRAAGCGTATSCSPTRLPIRRSCASRWPATSRSSIPGVELSHVVLADFAQLAPDRSASLTLDPATAAQARLVVAGLAPNGPAKSAVTVTVETRVSEIGSDLGWTPAAPDIASATEDTPRLASPSPFCGQARSPSPRSPGPASSGSWCASSRSPGPSRALPLAAA